MTQLNPCTALRCMGAERNLRLRVVDRHLIRPAPLRSIPMCLNCRRTKYRRRGWFVRLGQFGALRRCGNDARCHALGRRAERSPCRWRGGPWPCLAIVAACACRPHWSSDRRCKVCFDVVRLSRIIARRPVAEVAGDGARSGRRLWPGRNQSSSYFFHPPTLRDLLA